MPEFECGVTGDANFPDGSARYGETAQSPSGLAQKVVAAQ